MKYQIRYNKTTINVETIEDAETQALSLLDPCAPFAARIVEIDENGVFILTIKTLQPNHA
jgi:hypothetical protein